MEAEALILLLLLRRGKKSLSRRVGDSVKSEMLFGSVVSATLNGRKLATEASIERTREQLRSIGVTSRISSDAIREAAAERARIAAERAAHGTTNRWLTSRLDDAAVFVLAKEAERIAVSEAVDAFAFARDEYVGQLPADVSDSLVKVWQSVGDKRTCPICDMLDGETVPVKEQFSRGDPPVHSHCRCSYYIDAAGAGQARAPVVAPPTASRPVARPPVKPTVKPATKPTAKPPKAAKPVVAAVDKKGTLDIRGKTVFELSGTTPDTLRKESLSYLRGGGIAREKAPITFEIFPDVKGPRLTDGRHRITVAREQGLTEVDAILRVIGPRGGVKSTRKIKVKI